MPITCRGAFCDHLGPHPRFSGKKAQKNKICVVQSYVGISGYFLSAFMNLVSEYKS